MIITRNPFDITKAADYTDNEIYEYWVDFDDQSSAKIMKPDSLMPMIIVGSKGSGKTHIMKYYSYELQKIRCRHTHTSLDNEKFIGIYIRCSAFNADQFSGMGVSDDIWSILYAYYWELCVGERLTSMLLDLSKEVKPFVFDEASLVKRIYSLFLVSVNKECTLYDLQEYLIDLQRKLQYQVHNFWLNGYDKPQVEILVPINHLTYGIPTLLKEFVPFFKDKYIMYLIDEMENFSEVQQRLIQSLVREKPAACTFRVGARPYGIRTYYTLGKVEENHDGSEFEKIMLDDELRSSSNYSQYLIRICENRLKDMSLPEGFKLADYIEAQLPSSLMEKIASKKESHSRSYMIKLTKRLDSLIVNKPDIDIIVANLSFPDDLIIERANVVLMYRRIKDKCDLLKSSEEIKESAYIYYSNHKTHSLHSSFLDKYRQDCFDMIVKEGRENIIYSGLDKLLILSCGTPRTILRILKAAFNNQLFNTGEIPFDKGKVLTISAQTAGISNTAEWFFEENRIPVLFQSRIVDSIIRLGNYLQALRFSDIPPECSINLFSVPFDEMSEVARYNFEKLKEYSYIIDANERREKNKTTKTGTYCLNSILLPKWELSLSKRGMISLNKDEANMLFDTSRHLEWDLYISAKLKQYNFPFQQKTRENNSLFDFDN